MINIALVEDQLMVRQGLLQLIELDQEFKVVVEANNGAEALEKIAQVRANSTSPDLIITDIQMPKMNGIRFIEALRAEGDQTPVLVLTTFNDHELLAQAIKVGCNGFLLKDAGLDKLCNAIRSVSQGQYLFEPQHSKMEGVQQEVLEIEVTPPAELDQLSEAELQILRFIAAGFSNKDIADCMSLAEGTIKNYISRILEKTHSRDRTQAVVKALTWKLI